MFKIGDRVKIKWTEKRKSSGEFAGLWPSTISRIEGREGEVIEDDNPCYPYVDFGGSDRFYLPSDSLVHSGSALVPEASAMGDLRFANTQLGRTACAFCGGQLRNPMGTDPRFQHCPKCEP